LSCSAITIKSVNSDLFAYRFGAQALAHGCNCQGSMRAGVTVGFRER
jgi:O-acetyl-ADP-ribose deacetylase (regulator of RNase III)